jgi:hypothetical protein
VGRIVKVLVESGETIKGRLLSATADEVTLAPILKKKLKKGEAAPPDLVYPYDKIKKALVQVEFGPDAD